MTKVGEIRSVSQFTEEYIKQTNITDEGTQTILRVMAEVIDHQFRIIPK